MAKVEDDETLVDPEKGTCWLFELTTEKMIDEIFRRLCIANLNFGHNQCTPPVETSAGTGTSHDQSQVTRQKPPSTVSPSTQSNSSPNLTGVTDAGDTPQGMAKTLESTFARNPSEQDVEELASGFKKLTTGEEKRRFQRSRFDTV